MPKSEEKCPKCGSKWLQSQNYHDGIAEIYECRSAIYADGSRSETAQCLKTQVANRDKTIADMRADALAAAEEIESFCSPLCPLDMGDSECLTHIGCAERRALLARLRGAEVVDYAATADDFLAEAAEAEEGLDKYDMEVGL